MTRYRITNPTSGIDLGTYEGADEWQALDRMAQAAGYRDYAHSADVCGETVEEHRSEVVVEVAAAPTEYRLIQSRSTGAQWVLHPHSMTCGDVTGADQRAEALTADLSTWATDDDANAWMMDPDAVLVIRVQDAP